MSAMTHVVTVTLLAGLAACSKKDSAGGAPASSESQKSTASPTAAATSIDVASAINKDYTGSYSSAKSMTYKTDTTFTIMIGRDCPALGCGELNAYGNGYDLKKLEGECPKGFLVTFELTDGASPTVGKHAARIGADGDHLTIRDRRRNSGLPGSATGSGPRSRWQQESVVATRTRGGKPYSRQFGRRGSAQPRRSTVSRRAA